MRIPFVFLPPLFSDDVYRHRWDGRVLAVGLDPYRYAPSDPRLQRLLKERSGRAPGAAEVATINHPEVPTVYGPLAQTLFALLAISPARASVTSIKAMAAAFDLLSIGCLLALSASHRSASLAALLYAIHPLAVIETAGEGHLDGIFTSLHLLSLVLLTRARGLMASAAFALASLVKVTPLAAAPAFFRSAGRRGILIAAAIFLSAHLPFASSLGPARGLSEYARSWEGNGVLYPGLVAVLDATRAAERAKNLYGSVVALLGHPRFLDLFWGIFYTGFLARAILALLFVVLVILIVRREKDAVRATGLSIAALLLVSPTLHPWYLIGVLPFAFLFRWTSVVWVAGAAPLAYLSARPGSPIHPDLIRAVEFWPALALLLLVDRRLETAREGVV